MVKTSMKPFDCLHDYSVIKFCTILISGESKYSYVESGHGIPQRICKQI